MPKPTSKNHKKIPARESAPIEPISDLRWVASSALNPFGVAAYGFTIFLVAVFFEDTHSNPVSIVHGERVSTEMIIFLSVAMLGFVATVCSIIAIYKVPSLLAKSLLVLVVLVNIWVAGLNLFSHEWKGGFEYYRFVTVLPPDLASSELKNARLALRERENTAINLASNSLNTTQFDEGYIDSCVQGHLRALTDQGTGYAHRCMYRINKYFGVNGSFPDIITGIKDIMIRQGWDSGDAWGTLAEYERLQQRDDIDSAVNALEPIAFYKDDEMVAVHYFDIESANTDNRFSLEKLDMAAEIAGGNRGESIYDDAKIADSQGILRFAQDNGYRYILVVSSQGDYFTNY